MTKQQIEAFKKITPGKWSFEQGRDANDFIVTEPSGNTLCEPNQPLFTDYTGLDEAIRKIPLEEARANGISMAALPDLVAEREKMITMLKEMREACAACFRVIATTSEQHIDLLDGELTAVGVKQGFGQRCQELIAEAEGGE